MNNIYFKNVRLTYKCKKCGKEHNHVTVTGLCFECYNKNKDKFIR